MNFHRGIPIVLLLLLDVALAFDHPIIEDRIRKEEIANKLARLLEEARQLTLKLAPNESKVSSTQLVNLAFAFRTCQMQVNLLR